MSKSITLAARVDADLDAELSRLATATGRSKSWLIKEALRSYVANEQQFFAAVEGLHCPLWRRPRHPPAARTRALASRDSPAGRTGPRRIRPQAMSRETPRPSCRTRAKSRVSPVARAARPLTRLPSSEATEPFSRMFVVTPIRYHF